MKINLQNIVNAQNRSLYWLANETGITYARIYSLCKGKNQLVKLNNIEKICIALNCTLDDLFTIEKTTVD